MKAGLGILVVGMRVLLDASIDFRILYRIHAVINNDPAVAEVKDVTGRNSGRYVFAEADITLRTPDLERPHKISERIERSIAKAVPNMDHIVIHCEPQIQQRSGMQYRLPITKD